MGCGEGAPAAALALWNETTLVKGSYIGCCWKKESYRWLRKWRLGCSRLLGVLVLKEGRKQKRKQRNNVEER